jgi:hypothetical protein
VSINSDAKTPISMKNAPILTLIFLFSGGMFADFTKTSISHDEKSATSTIVSNAEVEAFFENLKTLCGKSYGGVVVHPEEPPRGFTDPLVAHFTVCEADYIHIPFHVGENTSRTWMLTLSEEGLLFKHDHRHPDGTPERMTMYGGWATSEGSAFVQEFPADEYTISLRDNLRSHIWTIDLDENLTTYSYSLYLYENLYFRAEFDLTQPLNDNE